MERQVKERLVGAAVLMAAAIILIPEMLSGPDRHPGAGNENKISFGAGAARDTPIKTYTIDLTRPPGAQQIAGEDDRVPPPEDAATTQPPDSEATTQPAPQRATEAKAETTREAPKPPAKTAAPAASSSGERREAPAPSTVETPGKSGNTAAPPAPRPLASSPAAPTSSGWAVQLGSFSSRSTAERMVKQLRGKGHDAFVMPVKSGSTTLYRVRVGPMKDRAGAEAARRKLKALVPAATVVVHP